MREQLKQSNNDYSRLDSAESDQYARFNFSGKFQGKPVIWLCEFLTSVEEYGALDFNSKPDYIEIESGSDRVMLLRVVLNVGKITDQEIGKMIIMIRNYKRLCKGRHAFGKYSNDQ